MAQTQEIVRKEPSRRLIDAVDNCANAFEKTAKAVARAIEIGKQEGFSPKEVGDMIRERMMKAGFTKRTITRYLPAEAKRSEGYEQRKDKMSFQEPLSPDQYKSEDLPKYPRQFLIDIIHYLEQGQTIRQVVHEVKQINIKPEPIRTKPISIKPVQTKNYYSPQLDSNSPRQICVSQCLNILQKEKQSLTFEDLIRQACQQNKQIAAYIGDNYLTKYNFKLRPILQQLLDHGSITRTRQKPIILSWIG